MFLHLFLILIRSPFPLRWNGNYQRIEILPEIRIRYLSKIKAATTTSIIIVISISSAVE